MSVLFSKKFDHVSVKMNELRWFRVSNTVNIFFFIEDCEVFLQYK